MVGLLIIILLFAATLGALIGFFMADDKVL